MFDLHKEVETCNITVDLTPRQMDRPIAPPPTLQQVKRLQDFLGQYPQVELTPEHYFADGMVGRELFIPGESYVVGKMHRHEHLVQLLSGTATILTDHGMETITGPKTWVSPPGAKRPLYTHTDCVFFTVHLNESNTRDIGQIEDYVIVPEAQIEYEAPQLAEFADALQGVYA